MSHQEERVVQSIYARFLIPPNLQEHMLRVAALAGTIAGKCKGAGIDLSALTAACLLHDLGNIVKFDMDTYPQYLGAEVGRRDHWKNVQRDIIEKYGEDDHAVTAAMLIEANIPEDIRDLIDLKSFPNAIQVADGQNWAAKVFLYSDLRVSPFGIIPLEERLEELLLRLEKYHGRTDLADAARRIEKQLIEICGPELLTDKDMETIESRIPKMRDLILPTRRA